MILEMSTREVEPDITVVELRGRLMLGDQLTTIEHSIRKELESGCRKLVLDLCGLEFIDSAGLGMLVMSAGSMEEIGGRMCVATANARIAHLFEVTQLDRLVALHIDAESACRSLVSSGTATAS
jgi:anti-anti-sigma factor